MTAAPIGSPAPTRSGRQLRGYGDAGLLALLVLLLLAVSSWAGPSGPSQAHASPPGSSGLSTAALGASPGLSGPSSSPPFLGQAGILSSVSMVYDAHSGSFVAVAEDIGPGTEYAPSLETWTYSNGNWSELSLALAPPARIGASMTYDTLSDSVLLFGGLGPSGYLADTWSFNGTNWTNLTATAGTPPPARADSSFSWDVADSEAVLYDGLGPSGSNWANATTGMTPTWLFSSQHWKSVAQATSTVPPGRGAMAYDALDGYLLYVGGSNGPAPCGTATTYSFLGGTWTNLTASVTGAPPDRVDPSVTYDSATNQIVMFGGENCIAYQSGTWTYANGAWNRTMLTTEPGARADAAFAYDYLDNLSLMFGGTGATGLLADTWSFGASGWVQRGPVLSVPGTLSGANGATDDAGTNLTVVVQGVMDVGNTNYSYTGLPSSCPSTPGASFVCPSAGAGHYVLGGTIVSDVGSASLPAKPLLLNLPPDIESFNLSATETEPQVPVTLSALVAGGTAPYRYVYTGLPAGCLSEDVASIVCTPTGEGTFPVTVTVTDAAGESATQTVGVVVGPYPFLDALSVTEGLLDVGQSTEISLVAGGGSGPLTYTYTGLPAGCSSENTTDLVCSPTVWGTFTVTVHATDGYGYTASRSVRVQIDPELVATSLATNVTRVDFGDPVSIALVVNGGTSPIWITYIGLPAGCESENATDFSCTPRVEGTFTVEASIHDALGETSEISYTFAVGPTPVVIGPGPNPNGSPTNAQGGIPLWLTVGIGVLVLIAAVTAGTGAVVARDRSRARAGRALADQMLAEATSLGRQFGPLDDPTRHR
jgi:hypothetical protein